MNRVRALRETRANGKHVLFKIRTRAVKLVHETHARHIVLIRLTPHGLGLRFHASHAVEHGHGAIKDAKRALHFDRKVHVSRRINEVHAMPLPKTRRCRRRDRDTTLLLLLHPVHGRFTFVHFTDLVLLSGVEKHALRTRRFTGVNVCDDPEVSGEFKGIFSWHIFQFVS